MSSNLTSQRPINEIIHGGDDGPLMVAKVIRRLRGVRPGFWFSERVKSVKKRN
jgi:hypothetical protein